MQSAAQYARTRAAINVCLERCGYVEGKHFPAADWSGVSDDAKALVRSLLEVDPEKRLTADEASQHNWITTAGGQLDSVLQA